MVKRVSFSKPVITGVVCLQIENKRLQWEEAARDRIRFKRRIDNTEAVLKSVLLNKLQEMRISN